MTTRITVSACCSNDKQVVVSLYDTGSSTSTVIGLLQDGDCQDFYVYDSRKIQVTESVKAEGVQE